MGPESELGQFFWLSMAFSCAKTLGPRGWVPHGCCPMSMGREVEEEEEEKGEGGGKTRKRTPDAATTDRLLNK